MAHPYIAGGPPVPMKVALSDGKWQLEQAEDGVIQVFRYGEPHLEMIPGDTETRVMAILMEEIASLQRRLAAVTKKTIVGKE